MKKKKQIALMGNGKLKKSPLVYPIQITKEIFDKAQRMDLPNWEKLKIGFWAMVNIQKKGFTISKNVRQYEKLESAVSDFHLRNKKSGYTSLEIIHLLGRSANLNAQELLKAGEEKAKLINTKTQENEN